VLLQIECVQQAVSHSSLALQSWAGWPRRVETACGEEMVTSEGRREVAGGGRGDLWGRHQRKEWLHCGTRRERNDGLINLDSFCKPR
jgi:hypothetical protein